MKKVLYLCIIILCILYAPFVKAENAPKCSRDKFVNPIFYEAMRPLSKILWHNKITENEVKVTNSDGYSETYKCKLLCSTETFVSLDCSEKGDETEIHMYSLRPRNKELFYREDEIEIDYRYIVACHRKPCYDYDVTYTYNYDASGKEIIGDEEIWGVLIIQAPQPDNK